MAMPLRGKPRNRENDMSETIPSEQRTQREQQVQQAEELLGSLPQHTGVAKGLFEGRFVADCACSIGRTETAGATTR
jgi:hypothetical protein